MDTGRRVLLDRLWSEGRVFDAAQPDRLDRRRNLEPESAELLALLVRTAGAGRVLELGTSNGYSTIWLADAVEPDGRVTTVDLDPGRAAEATASLAAAGVSDVVEQLVADAGQVLADQADASCPLIFLDAERGLYASYWADLLRALTPGGLLVVDNCVSHADQVADFRALVDAEPSVRSALVPIGAGLLLISKDR